MLICAVALTLFAVSLVFALKGIDGGDTKPAGTLVLDPVRSGSAGKAKAVPVAVVSPVPGRSTAAERRASRRRDRVRANAASTASAAPGSSNVTEIGKGTSDEPPLQEPSAPTATSPPAPNLGDGVRQIGDGVSSTVRATGSKLAEATAPLGPVVSTATLEVLNLVAALIKGTTDALGGLLGARP
jgi:hypothetical protein